MCILLLLILLFIQVEKHTLCIFIISTYADGMPPDSATWFFQYITESSNDCRVPKHLLTGLQYTIFGLGNSSYGTEFNAVCISSVVVLMYQIGLVGNSGYFV